VLAGRQGLPRSGHRALAHQSALNRISVSTNDPIKYWMPFLSRIDKFHRPIFQSYHRCEWRGAFLWPFYCPPKSGNSTKKARCFAIGQQLKFWKLISYSYLGRDKFAAVLSYDNSFAHVHGMSAYLAEWGASVRRLSTHIVYSDRSTGGEQDQQ
jgi:hypothetical protein